MRRVLALAVALTLLLATGAPAAAKPPPPPGTPTITFENPPPDGVLELAVGESQTFDVTVTSGEPFILAIARADQFFPGRGVFFAGTDRATQATQADLDLSIQGKEPTAFLPDGVAPVAIVVGVRYKGGVVLSERFDFNVKVVEPAA